MRRLRAWTIRRLVAMVIMTVVMAMASGLLRAQILGTVTNQRGLAFGTVISGTTTSIAPTAAGAAMWWVHGAITIGGGFTFTLPNNLTTSGGATMPITFCTTCAIYRVGNTSPAGGTTFNPKNGNGLVLAVVSDIYIWLGASVNPPLTQTPGHYTGTVVFTVAGLL